MDPHRPSLPSPPSLNVSNLVPSWEEQIEEDGGHFEPAGVAAAVEQAVRAEAPPTRPMAYDLLREEPAAPAAPVADDERALEPELPGEHDLDYGDLRRRDIARELLRARLVAIAEQREHRSAYEIVFIMLAAAVAVLLAAPPLVQVLLAAHGTQV